MAGQTGNMESAQRVELLRQRYKAKGGIAYVGRGNVALKPAERKRRNFSAAYVHGAQVSATHCDWLNAPDARRKVTPRTNRKRGLHPLNKIAEQLPRKLPRVLFDL